MCMWFISTQSWIPKLHEVRDRKGYPLYTKAQVTLQIKN